MEKLQLVALVPRYGADFEEILIFTNEETAMAYWRFIPARDCVSVVKMYEDALSDAWILSL